MAMKLVVICCAVVSVSSTTSCSDQELADGTCGAATSNRMLLQRGSLAGVHIDQDKAQLNTTHGETEEELESELYDLDESHQVSGDDVSCLDGVTKRTRISPEIVNQKGNEWNTVMKCKYNVDWDKSPWLLDIMRKNKDDPEKFMFKVCWADEADPEHRSFPWLQTNTADWKFHLMHNGTGKTVGAVVITPMDLNPLWMKGFANIMHDALDYFCRMGKVDKRLILPRFMVYGWSKGATANWVLGRWRPDIVQAVVSVSGVDGNKFYTNKPPVKSKGAGMSPYFFVSSPLDDFTPNAPKDSDKEYKRQKDMAICAEVTTQHSTPCGHHPDSCWPVCDMHEVFFTPFFDFVSRATRWRGCPHWKTQKDCDAYLCKWDSELKACDMKHPTEMNPSCNRFCEKTLVEACGGAESCESSYRIQSVEEASAEGMHVACKLEGESCVDSVDSFQCFFQDWCGTE